MKRTKKILKYLGFVIIALAIIYFSIWASTGLWFNHHYQVDNFHIYSDSEITSPDILVEKLNNRLGACEIFQEDLEHKIHICSSGKKVKFIAKMVGVSYPTKGFNVEGVKKIFLSQAFINEAYNYRKVTNRLIPYSVAGADMADVICHEIIHSFVYDEFGSKKYYLLPLWKQEGYAEYAAYISVKKKDSLYNFNDRVDIYFDDAFWREEHKVVKDYYEAQLLVENLIDYEGISFNELMSDSMTFENAIIKLNNRIR